MERTAAAYPEDPERRCVDWCDEPCMDGTQASATGERHSRGANFDIVFVSGDGTAITRRA